MGTRRNGRILSPASIATLQWLCHNMGKFHYKFNVCKSSSCCNVSISSYALLTLEKRYWWWTFSFFVYLTGRLRYLIMQLWSKSALVWLYVKWMQKYRKKKLRDGGSPQLKCRETDFIGDRDNRSKNLMVYVRPLVWIAWFLGFPLTFSDMNGFKKTGRIIFTSDLGEEYGLKDIDGESI